MRAALRPLCLTICLLAMLNLEAQELRTVQGKLVDSAYKPLVKVSVALWYKGSTDTLRTLTGNEGQFQFSEVREQAFSLKATYQGYTALVRDYSLMKGKLDLGTLAMEPLFTTLQEIVIAPPPIQIKEDTVEYKADSFRVKPNALVEDLLKKLPGVQVDKDGNVSAQGKQVTRVKVNGKDFFQGDVRTATRELNADMIDKVQIVDDYGDQANVSGIRDGEPEKVINLQLKKDRNKGVFGRATAGYGTNDRYQATGSLNYFNNNKQLSVIGNSNNINSTTFNGGDGNGGGGGGQGVNLGGNNGGSGGGRPGGGMSINMGGMPIGGQGSGLTNAGGDGITSTHSIGTNFRNDFEKSKGSSFYGSYTFTRRMTDGIRDVATQSLAPNNSFTDNRNTKFYNQSNTHRAFLNLEYNLDSFNYIKISPQLSFSEGDNQNRAVFNQFNDKGVQTQSGFQVDSALSYTPSLNLNFLYNHRFRRKGRNLSVNAGLSGSQAGSDRNSLNVTDFLVLGLTRTEQLRQQDNDNRGISLRVVYSEPVARDRFLDLSYSYRNNFARNDGRVYDIRNNSPVFNSLLSNAFENDFTQQRIGASVRTVKKKYNYTLGLVALPVSLKGYSISKDSSYTPQQRVNMLPVARLAYNFTRTRGLNINYQGDVQQPSFQQLQPLVDNSNPQVITTGNPSLKPAISHNLNAFYNNFNFSSGKVLFLGITANVVQNNIVTNSVWLGNNGRRLDRPENVNGYYSLRGFYNWSKPYQNRTYVFSLNGSVGYRHDVGLVDSLRNVGNIIDAVQGVNFEFNHKDWLEWDFGAMYMLSSNRYSLQEQQNFFTGRWTLTSNSRADLPGGLIFRYDLQYVINYGLADGVNGNIVLLNSSLEKTVFKKKNGFIRLSHFDLLNQNKNITRTVTGNSVIDTRVNRLNRYVMLSFTYRLNRFQGSGENRQGMRVMPMN